ncbi:substrate-binding domain-containing protein [Paracoccus tegillarcae]|uniref:Catabolite repressor protein n=1 Tax=Paracoccus tegillarcae TaxID=1529068 RepID=A0A2K9F1V8_9RHOB|nr:substrate-binding domain-containing protein [Paracoccus tegillarcae]AUH34352.1 catabolite repressor protein [Paracoccus tegillarcae]
MQERDPKKPRQKSTIYDIAQKAGTSPSAVSAALTGKWKQRRLKKETVDRIRKIAGQEGYTANRQARGLRKAESGLAGMVLPDHENRFFAELSQQFAREAHARGLCPATVHAGRDAEAQLSAVESLIAYSVDLVVIAGATEPLALARACRAANVPHVFVDHPCAEAPSVVTDNTHGASLLTDTLLNEMPQPVISDPGSWLYFLGGEMHLPASAERIQGFRQRTQAAEAFFSEDQIIACGYEDTKAEQALADLHDELGRLPAGVFVNSIGCFEGVMRYLSRLPEAQICGARLGCYDYDPFATLSRFPLRMIRQRADLIISEAFGQLDAGISDASLIRVSPELI